MRLLVVEDDEGIARGLADNMRLHGWAVDITAAVGPAWAALRAEAFDAVLLDLGLPDGDGSQLLRQLRASKGPCPDPLTPVLIMTARDTVGDRIEGLDLGADDYVTKPFDFNEVAARLRALRRRAVGRASPVIAHGDLEVDPAARTVRSGGLPVDVSTREFDVLLVLLEASPRVLSRGQIEARMYNWEAALDSNAIEVHIHRLRRKLGEGLIRTVRGVGYFVPEPVAR
ncbi:response regulator transcription factor [Ramlibacter sp. Leaf400]|uniref:response regulator transcription factor n=1 Tax=Ramlibacter sp. Leaf400 TaxID=1736365 RepID=UPI0006FA7025|nr:response regulator transcription factor [Ramlibacter sp. Leaf400]KQT11591.1 two-component system response regulator [Ramlibacter sp. Leaf400]